MKAMFSIFGVQPLIYSDDVREQLLINFINYKPYHQKDYPDWLLELENLYKNEQFNSFLIFHKDIFEKIFGCDFTLTAHLLANTRLNLFAIVFELNSNGSYKTMLDTSAIRQMLVLSNDDKRLSIVKEATEKACTMAADMLGIRKDDIIIKNDTCNVTIFIKSENTEHVPLTTNICSSFIQVDNVERITTGRENLDISNETVILFGGRVHLVATTSYNDTVVIKNIFFNLQFMWFFVPIYLRESAKLHLNIVSGDINYNNDELEDKSETLNYISQTIMLQNESSKISYENFTRSFYERVEDLWRIEKSISQFGIYASFFESYIRNTRDKHARKADEILNYVLAALAIFGVVGFWADILHAELITHEWKTFGFFWKNATDSIFGFTTIFFVFIGIFIASILISYSIKLKHGKKRRKKNKNNNFF